MLWADGRRFYDIQYDDGVDIKRRGDVIGMSIQNMREGAEAELKAEAEAEAEESVKAAAENGNARAQFNLGFMYEHGYGVVKNEEEKKKWYRKAEQQKYAIA